MEAIYQKGYAKRARFFSVRTVKAGAIVRKFDKTSYHNFCSERSKLRKNEKRISKLKVNQLPQAIIEHALHACHNG